MEDTRRTQPTESTTQGRYRLMEMEAASTEVAWVCTRSSALHFMPVSLVVFVGLLTVEVGVSLALLSALGSLFFL